MTVIGESQAIGAAAAARASALRKTETKEVEKVHPEQEDLTADDASLKEFIILIGAVVMIYSVIELIGLTKKSVKRRGSAV